MQISLDPLSSFSISKRCYRGPMGNLPQFIVKQAIVSM